MINETVSQSVVMRAEPLIHNNSDDNDTIIIMMVMIMVIHNCWKG